MFASNRWRKCKKERTIKTNSQQEAFLHKRIPVDYLYGETFDNMEDFLAVTDTRLSIKKHATAEITFLMFGCM
jgi:hypothetical protein